MAHSLLTDASFATFVAPPNALARGRAKRARRVPPPLHRRDWHYRPEEIRRVADYVTAQRDEGEGGPVGFALVLEIHAAPHLYNEDHDLMVRADQMRRGLDPDSRDDAYDDHLEMRGGW